MPRATCIVRTDSPPKQEEPGVRLADMTDEIASPAGRWVVEELERVIYDESIYVEVTLNEAHRFSFHLYSDRYRFAIAATGEPDSADSYLGCIMSCRAPSPGETHLRGSDLPDGKLTRETMNAIFVAIARVSLVEIVPRKRPRKKKR